MRTFFSTNAFRRSTRNSDLVHAAALVRNTLARTLQRSANGQPMPWAAVATAKKRDRDGATLGGVLPAVQDMLDRLSTLRPGSPLCETSILAQAKPPIAVPDGASFEERTFRAPTGTLNYRLYVPSSAGSNAMPLVVMLHGCTQSPEDFAVGTRMNEVAEAEGFLVAYPRQTQTANLQRCWNWFEPKNQHRDRGEPALIAGLTREISSSHAVDPARVYIAGLSAGGAAAAIMGQTYPDLYAAVGVHSGLAAGAASDMPSAFTAMRQGGARPDGNLPIPTIVFHGDLDRTVHSANGDEVLAQARAGTVLKADTSRGRATGGLDYTRIVQSDETGRPLLELWTLHGAGHAWSGGSPAGSYTEPRGPDASREMTRFFLQHANATITH